ncbi:YdbL family protein [Candidatus Marithrix sp. Canyon 246]|uniref:YdbL family protein n=1 Tax=Candidatus Marithrix sp. Canyon 246 TaxID=1827136 RepID=UPI00084A1EEF|nr:YdbL family protein [Candidatus Marithrix sp. Canyon 246]
MIFYIRYISLLSLGLLISCVTINVYFPAAAAEQAADQIINKVWNDKTTNSSNNYNDINLEISSPTSTALQRKMTARHKKLKKYYNNGAIGITNNAFIMLRSPMKVALKKRNHVNQLVKAENKDRLQLYAEIALINGHPEWVENIRTIFASRWIQRASQGWRYQDNQGTWQRK